MPRNWAWSDVEVAVPPRSSLPPGVRMAGFRQRAATPWDITMVAHPSVTLLIDLSEGEGVDYDGAGLRGSAVIGLLPGRLRATGRARVECLQIRLDPAVAAAVLGESPELTGRVAPLGAAWEARLRAAASWGERFAVAAALLERRERTRRVDPEVAHVWRRTRVSRGRVRVDELAAEVGWSRQRLWSRFRAQLGITPKRAAQLVRFDRAAHLLAAGHAPAGVAGASGYADQSHLHREVVAFTGLTPAAVATAPWLGIDDVAWAP
ncbi:helix-turn-helix domain-containing protein [Actinoplanes sp. NPDC048988]|uniref:helix-turn-helix domain-containing protein n=1 Tax=Actinoplanes sp. NPDC048988 TaxID=3363901 RepID=UPI0037158FBF